MGLGWWREGCCCLQQVTLVLALEQLGTCKECAHEIHLLLLLRLLLLRLLLRLLLLRLLLRLLLLRFLLRLLLLRLLLRLLLLRLLLRLLLLRLLLRLLLLLINPGSTGGAPGAVPDLATCRAPASSR